MTGSSITHFGQCSNLRKFSKNSSHSASVPRKSSTMFPHSLRKPTIKSLRLAIISLPFLEISIFYLDLSLHQTMLSEERTIKKNSFCAGCLPPAVWLTPRSRQARSQLQKSIVTIPIVTKHNTKVNTFCHKNIHPFGYYIWTNVTFFKIITFSHCHKKLTLTPTHPATPSRNQKQKTVIKLQYSLQLQGIVYNPAQPITSRREWNP